MWSGNEAEAIQGEVLEDLATGNVLLRMILRITAQPLEGRVYNLSA
jgi:hypothetical protein